MEITAALRVDCVDSWDIGAVGDGGQAVIISARAEKSARKPSHFVLKIQLKDCSNAYGVSI